MHTTRRKGIALGLAAFGAGLGIVFSGNTPSLAADQDGHVDSSEFVLYYNSAEYGYGSFSDFHRDNVADLAPYKYLSSGNGKGQYVKNNAAAVWNNNGLSSGLYYNSNFNCNIACEDFDAHYRGDISPALKNQDASFLRFDF